GGGSSDAGSGTNGANATAGPAAASAGAITAGLYHYQDSRVIGDLTITSVSTSRNNPYMDYTLSQVGAMGSHPLELEHRTAVPTGSSSGPPYTDDSNNKQCHLKFEAVSNGVKVTQSGQDPCT